MHRSSRAFPLLVLFFLFSFATLSGQSTQQPTAGSPQKPQSQPVQDLTPLSDAEAEKAATPAPPASAPKTASEKTAVKKNKDDSFTFVKDVEEVALYATVVDPRNRMVNDLDKNAFSVFEDSKPQQITSFRRDDIPVSMGLLIDNSGSMRTRRPAVNQAALNLVRASNPQDEVFIVNFNDEAYNDQDFTANINLLKEGLEKVEARGGTALYDAVVASADHLSKGGKNEKKVLVVVSDGEDTVSLHSLEESVKWVQNENGPVVYSIGILDMQGRGGKRAKRALERLSAETGGIAYFPKGFEEVDSISQAVAHDIRNQYTIGYKPTRPQSEGGFRSVRVEARADGKPKLQVRTRSGYYAGQHDKPESPAPKAKTKQ